MGFFLEKTAFACEPPQWIFYLKQIKNHFSLQEYAKIQEPQPKITTTDVKSW